MGNQLLPQPAERNLRRGGFAIHKTLDLGDAAKPQHGLLLVRLRPFRNHRHRQCVAQLRDGVDNGARGVGRNARHKGAVNLELIHRQLLQVGEGRVANAKIVQRNGDSRRAQSRQLKLDRRPVGQEDLLGDFHLHQRGGAVVLGQRPQNEGVRPAIEQFGRHIDPHPAGKAKLSGLEDEVGRFCNHRLGQRLDQAGFLRKGDEFAGGDKAECLVRPPRQRLKAHCGAGGRRGLPLEDGKQAIVRKRAPQGPLHRKPADQLLLHALVEPFHPAPAAALGLVKGKVGAAHDGGGGGGPCLRARNANAEAALHLLPLHLHRLGHHGDQRIERGPQPLRCRAPGTHDGKLVAPLAHGNVPLRRRAADHGRHRHQILVARPMAERVVDALEMIQIDEADGNRLPVHRQKGAIEGAAVGKAGQKVMVGEVSHPRLLAHTLGGVGGNQNVAKVDAFFVLDRRAAHMKVGGRPAGGSGDGRVEPGALFGVQKPGQLLGAARQTVGRKAPPHGNFRKEPLRRRVDEQHRALLVEHDDSILQGVQRAANPVPLAPRDLRIGRAHGAQLPLPPAERVERARKVADDVAPLGVGHGRVKLAPADGGNALPNPRQRAGQMAKHQVEADPHGKEHQKRQEHPPLGGHRQRPLHRLAVKHQLQRADGARVGPVAKGDGPHAQNIVLRDRTAVVGDLGHHAPPRIAHRDRKDQRVGGRRLRQLLHLPHVKVPKGGGDGVARQIAHKVGARFHFRAQMLAQLTNVDDNGNRCQHRHRCDRRGDHAGAKPVFRQHAHFADPDPQSTGVLRP
ncbi:MAG: hypothetical protein AAF318_02965 [Pseudomonadota bacterium]